jgi:hypothetical protein
VNGFIYYTTQNSLTNLKKETQQKIDSIENENKNIQQKIENITIDSKNLQIKIDDIEGENNNLKNNIIDTQSQLTSLKNDVNDLEREFGLKWITIRNVTGSGQYQHDPPFEADWIHLNSTNLQINWSFKETSNVSTGSQFNIGLHGGSGTLPGDAEGTVAGYLSPFLLEGSGALSYHSLVLGPYFIGVYATNSTKWNIVVKYWSGS